MQPFSSVSDSYGCPFHIWKAFSVPGQVFSLHSGKTWDIRPFHRWKIHTSHAWQNQSPGIFPPVFSPLFGFHSRTAGWQNIFRTVPCSQSLISASIPPVLYGGGLVLIFMATAPIISQSVQVELPDSVQSQNVSNEDKTPVILEVAGVGQYSISIGGQRQEGLNEEMVTQLSKQEFDKDNNTMFLVGGAKDVPYEEVIKALNLLHLAGIKSVGLMTNPI